MLCSPDAPRGYASRLAIQPEHSTIWLKVRGAPNVSRQPTPNGLPRSGKFLVTRVSMGGQNAGDNMISDKSADGVYSFDPEQKIWKRPAEKAFSYSDGDDVEERIAGIVAGSLDRSTTSVEFLDAITDWPSNYHLNPRRANLLRPLRPLLKGDILEIGAGTGAITRFLGENGARVVAVEGSPRRASIAARRCEDLPNVQVIADDFTAYPAGPKFDVVTLIGVLEYARVFFRTGQDDPIDALIQRARSFVHPGGVLIVAIENQLGLKYLAGALEDHLGVPMLGVEDRYGPNTPVTFGRAELSQKLASGGLPHQQWWFPTPDYKLPVTLLSDEILRHDADLSALLKETVRADPQLSGPLAFSLEQAWGPVFRNKLALDLANSFLVLGSDAALPPHNVLAVHYGGFRRREFAREVIFEWRDGQTLVRRSRLYPEAVGSDQSPVTLELHDEKLLSAANWQSELVSLTKREGWRFAELAAWSHRWIDVVLSESGTASYGYPEFTTKLPGRFFDAIPRNLGFDQDGKPVFFDQEWVLNQPLELGYLFCRGIMESLDSLIDCSRPEPGATVDKLSLLLGLAKTFGWNFAPEDAERYLEAESRVQMAICGGVARSMEDMSHPIADRGDYGKLRLERLSQLELELDDICRRHDEVSARLAQAGRQLNELTRLMAERTQAGDAQSARLAMAYARPWIPLRQFAVRAGLRFVLLFASLMPDTLCRRLKHELGVRHPTRFHGEWARAGRQATAGETPIDETA